MQNNGWVERDGREPHREDCQGDGGHQGGGDEGVGAPHLPEAGDRAATRKRCHAGEEDVTINNTMYKSLREHIFQ